MTYREETIGDCIFTGANADEVGDLIEAYHYSRRLPANLQHCYVARSLGGLFGDFGFPVAAAMFSVPPTRWGEDVLELSRLVRHPNYCAPLSSLLAYSCRQLKKKNRDLVVSFADWTQGHHGGIYQASGWYYGGKRERCMDGVLLDGVFVPGRSCNSKWGTRSPKLLSKRFGEGRIRPHYDDGKHLYWRALSVSGKTKAKRLGLEMKPYPKPASAARLLDAPEPTGVSKAQTLGAAPIQTGDAA